MNKHHSNAFKKIKKKISYRTGDIPIKALYQWRNLPNEKMTDIQEIQNYLELVYQHRRDFFIKNHKEIWLVISRYMSYFSKAVSQITDWQIYYKFRIIRILCTNISGMSTKKSELCSIQNGRYPYICLISVMKWAN